MLKINRNPKRTYEKEILIKFDSENKIFIRIFD